MTLFESFRTHAVICLAAGRPGILENIHGVMAAEIATTRDMAGNDGAGATDAASAVDIDCPSCPKLGIDEVEDFAHLCHSRDANITDGHAEVSNTLGELTIIPLHVALGIFRVALKRFSQVQEAGDAKMLQVFEERAVLAVLDLGTGIVSGDEVLMNPVGVVWFWFSFHDNQYSMPKPIVKLLVRNL